MENATKALMIAGAILITILIIGVGILILNSTGGMEEEVGLVSDSQATRTFNSQFEQYLGTNIPLVQVKSLISTVNAVNSKLSNKEITMTGVANVDGTYDISSVNKPRYKVTALYGSDGKIASIKVVEQ